MNPPRLYTDLAHLWPHLSPPEDYAQETAELIELIDHALGEPSDGQRWSVLEIGAGAGHSTVHLKERYDVTASDLSPQMLEHCQALNPDVSTVQGDMRDMRLGKQFDAVILCDAIDYMTTREDAVAALRTIAAHLRPGGVALFAPTYTAETFTDNEAANDTVPLPTHGTENETLTYFSFVHDPDPADTQFEMILMCLLREQKTRQIKTIEDRHTCGLFTIADWQAMASEAGLHVEALAQQQDTEDAEPPEAYETPGASGGAWSVVFCGTLGV